ncbi:MAG: proline dehydrogenase family protein [Lewinellaceae bacterium]|nr:proline dehydrogenase family protein [Saprospiraceae bacterium]MCB0543175.1 proline dehydrogenase family protein [Saprospiraceae bacterium]MCB9356768.1 proline dehydrogenase family protein [Lewinellaceae bacterium]
MSIPWLVKYGSKFGLWAIENGFPFAETVVKNTIFEQFVGGTTLLDSQGNIDRLAAHNTLTILDYGAEAKETEIDFNHTMNENIRAIDFASRSKSIPVVSTKITGLARFHLLEKVQHRPTLTREELSEYRNVLKRIDAVCYHAANKGVSIYIDAEESWIQDTIDHLVWLMMKRYNKKRVVVYNTFQMYRKDRLQFLIDSYDRARKAGFLLGAKLVRGAYMEKEAFYAALYGNENPINPDKNATDDHYNTAIRFCIDHLETLAFCNASHNAESAELQVELMAKRRIPNDHPHTMFSQLFGMSDNLTFNLANAGYRVSKYVPYGQVREVIPYLIRRTQENSSVTGTVGRELIRIQEEVGRRGL